MHELELAVTSMHLASIVHLPVGASLLHLCAHALQNLVNLRMSLIEHLVKKRIDVTATLKSYIVPRRLCIRKQFKKIVQLHNTLSVSCPCRINLFIKNSYIYKFCSISMIQQSMGVFNSYTYSVTSMKVENFYGAHFTIDQDLCKTVNRLCCTSLSFPSLIIFTQITIKPRPWHLAPCVLCSSVLLI